jgi:enoyl-CoA hydratase
LVVGVPFPGIALEVVRAVVPAPERRRLVLEGHLLMAQDSLRVGLVDQVVEKSDLLRLAIKKAQTLGQIPSSSFALTKQQLRTPLLHRLQLLGADHDARVSESWEAPDVLTAIRDFVAQRLGNGG